MSPGEPLKLLILPTISIKTDTTKSRHLDNAAANAKFDFADSFSDAFMIFCSFWSMVIYFRGHFRQLHLYTLLGKLDH